LTEVAAIHRGEHSTAAAYCWWQYALLQSFNLLDEELSKFVGASMSVEVEAGLRHVTRLMKITARARGHTNFDLNYGPLL